jgi:hypothetical protein
MSRLAFLLAILVAPTFASAGPKAVVELFTSQGCSSCVPADRYLEELAERDDVLALSFHVDYWDYLGWHDTLADPANTERQRDYAEVRGNRQIYTPQMVVNGGAELVGSDRVGVEAAIRRAALPVPVEMHRRDGKVEIEIAARPLPRPWPTTIRLVLYASESEVAISRGENAGETIAYYNVVRTMRPIGMWDGAAVEITLPGDELMADGVDGCAVIVQEDLPNGPGRILGAAQLGDW